MRLPVISMLMLLQFVGSYHCLTQPEMYVQNVCPKQSPPNTGTVKLAVIDKFLILELVVDKPGIYL